MMQPLKRQFGVLAVSLVLAGSGSLMARQRAGSAPGTPAAAGTPSLPSIAIQPLTSPAGANSSGPQLTTLKDRTVLSWLESNGAGGALKFAERTPNGWGEARTVVSNAHLIVNAADVPSVRLVSDGSLVAHWTEENGPDPEASKLRVSWSKDGGKTWAAPVSPNLDKTQTQHGFAALFDAPGGFGVVWLDGRAPNEDMALRARVYSAGKPGAETVVDRRVCECCETATAQTTDGVAVAYRDRSASEIRDIYVSRMAAGKWTPPVLVHKDDWKIDACPINGPALSASGNEMVVAWFAAPKEQGHSFLAFSHDGGKAFDAPIRVDDASSLGRMDVALMPDGSAAVSWVEFASNMSQVKARRIDRTGARSAAVTLAPAAGAQHPRLVQTGGDLTLAWTENAQGMHVRTAHAALK